jgi:hypothetical protein
VAASDFTPEALAAAAAVDPWALARRLTDGRPGEVEAVGRAFDARGLEAAEVARLGRIADGTSAAAFTNDWVGVYDSEASATTARTLLAGNGESMREVGGLFIRLAAVLTDSASAASSAVSTMETEINDVITRRNAAAAVPMSPEDREAADRRFVAEAVNRVRTAGARVQAEIDKYHGAVRSQIAHLGELGYVPPTANLGAGVGDLTPPPPGADPTRNAAWWNHGLTAAQREQILLEHPGWIGNLDGIPAGARDQANRRLLGSETARLDHELATATTRWQASLAEQLPPGMEGQGETRDQLQFRYEVERLTDQRNALTAVTDTIAEPGRQLLLLDISATAEPRAAVAVGDVDTADHVAVFTPGFTTTTAGSLNSYVNDMTPLQQTADRLLFNDGRAGESVAAVAWLGYDAPQWDTLGYPDLSVGLSAAAQQGGSRLAGFINGISASRPDDPHLTALGHSYGSTTTGYALQHTNGVDNAVLFGSPGAATDDITDLRVPAGHVGVLEARQDAVADLGAFGGDTNQLDGVTNLSARQETAPDGTPLRESLGHSDYLAPGTTSQYNIAATVAGLPDRRITGTNTGLGDYLRAAWDAF